MKSADPDSGEYDDIIKKIKDLPVVQTAWADFLKFLQKLQAESVFVELSGSMELSLHAEVPRWHFHLTVSNIRAQRTDRQNGQIVLLKETLDTFAPQPTVRISYARGRSAENAVHRLHCYSQWHKVGGLYTLDNFPRGRDFVCKASWTMAAWQVRKLSYKTARKELIANRDNVEASLMELTGVWLAEIEEYMRSEQRKAAEAAEHNRYPFKSFPDVDEWKVFLHSRVLREADKVRVPRPRWGLALRQDDVRDQHLWDPRHLRLQLPGGDAAVLVRIRSPRAQGDPARRALP